MPAPTDNARDFAANLPPQGRLLGLDVGETTIGLALSDALRSIASPLSTISRTKFQKDMALLQSTIEKNKVVGLVIGFPVNMDGSQGPRIQSTRTFTSNLGKHIALPVCFWDERLSTMAVERTMLEADLSRQRRVELVDKLAASYMLQGLLDHLRNL
ncbi:MAG: Holliday junction resolvase RuvX [Proteobacteria bacterium]|nr:Holliday junction resolvase RuvX [Pseudomonadota bacterium]